MLDQYPDEFIKRSQFHSSYQNTAEQPYVKRLVDCFPALFAPICLTTSFHIGFAILFICNLLIRTALANQTTIY